MFGFHHGFPLLSMIGTNPISSDLSPWYATSANTAIVYGRNILLGYTRDFENIRAKAIEILAFPVPDILGH